MLTDRARRWWRSLTSWDRELARRAAENLDQEAESRRKANRDFDRHGPSRRDRLPGGRLEQKTGRRGGRWLDRW